MKICQHIIALLAVTIFATQGCVAMNKDGQDDMQIITGTVKVTGNAPFTQIVLIPGPENPDTVPADRIYLITGALAKELMARYQYKKVTVKGRPCNSPSVEFKNCFEPVEIIRAE